MSVQRRIRLFATVASLCLATMGANECDPKPEGPEPTPEVCNGIDDDLDGAVDEDLVRPCTTPYGSGEETCVDGAWQGCTGPGLACGDGTAEQDGRCVCTYHELHCGTGTALDGDTCRCGYPEVVCAEGTTLDAGACWCSYAEMSCGPGTVLDGDMCHCGYDEVLCGDGTGLADGACWCTYDHVDCGAGTELDGDLCVCAYDAVQCGPGTILVDGACRVETAPLVCGDGTIAWGGQCVLRYTPAYDCTPTDPPTEVCDDLDNDCDGTIDNGCGLPAPVTPEEPVDTDATAYACAPWFNGGRAAAGASGRIFLNEFSGSQSNPGSLHVLSAAGELTLNVNTALPYGGGGLVRAPDGRLYAGGGDWSTAQVVEVDPSTGATLAVRFNGEAGNYARLHAATSDGRFYLTAGGTVYRTSGASAAAAVWPSLPFAPSSIATTSSANRTYVAGGHELGYVDADGDFTALDSRADAVARTLVTNPRGDVFALWVAGNTYECEMGYGTCIYTVRRYDVYTNALVQELPFARAVRGLVYDPHMSRLVAILAHQPAPLPPCGADSSSAFMRLNPDPGDDPGGPLFDVALGAYACLPRWYNGGAAVPAAAGDLLVAEFSGSHSSAGTLHRLGSDGVMVEDVNTNIPLGGAGLVRSPDGRVFAGGGDWGTTSYVEIDPATGATLGQVFVGPPASYATLLAADGEGRLYFRSDGTVFRTTGPTTAAPALGALGYLPTALSFDADGTVYASDGTGVGILPPGGSYLPLGRLTEGRVRHIVTDGAGNRYAVQVVGDEFDCMMGMGECHYALVHFPGAGAAPVTVLTMENPPRTAFYDPAGGVIVVVANLSDGFEIPPCGAADAIAVYRVNPGLLGNDEPGDDEFHERPGFVATCTAGTTLVGASPNVECVSDVALGMTECGSHTEWVDGVCEATIFCGPDTVLQGEVCVSTVEPERFCGTGTVYQGGVCRPAAIPNCDAKKAECDANCQVDPQQYYGTMTAREIVYWRSGCGGACQDFYNYCRAVERVLEGTW